MKKEEEKEEEEKKSSSIVDIKTCPVQFLYLPSEESQLISYASVALVISTSLIPAAVT